MPSAPSQLFSYSAVIWSSEILKSLANKDTNVWRCLFYRVQMFHWYTWRLEEELQRSCIFMNNCFLLWDVNLTTSLISTAKPSDISKYVMEHTLLHSLFIKYWNFWNINQYTVTPVKKKGSSKLVCNLAFYPTQQIWRLEDRMLTLIFIVGYVEKCGDFSKPSNCKWFKEIVICPAL